MEYKENSGVDKGYQCLTEFAVSEKSANAQESESSDLHLYLSTLGQDRHAKLKQIALP